MRNTSHVETAGIGTAPVGFWARFHAALVKSREVQAHREINRHLSRRSDRELLDIGMTEAEIAKLRSDQSY